MCYYTRCCTFVPLLSIIIDFTDCESRLSESETTVLVLSIVVGILVLLLIVSIIVIVGLVCERQIKQKNHPSIINLR